MRFSIVAAAALVVALSVVGLANASAGTPRSAASSARACIAKAVVGETFKITDQGTGFIVRFPRRVSTPWKHPWGSVTYNDFAGKLVPLKITDSMNARESAIFKRCTPVR